MMMGMGPRTLAWLREMEPFVRICHGHFPLKQCTLEADPHLVGINVCGLMAGKLRMENGPFSILGSGGGDYLSVSEGKRGGNNSTSRQECKNRCGVVPRHRCLPLLHQKRERRISFTATMILVNGPRVTTYCDPPKLNKNLISLE